MKILKTIFALFQKNKYMEWNEYKKRIDFIDDFSFQQKVRNENIKNI
ncbi:MAG: hypothetical protein ACTSQY_10510 [Candidatus Odinarchaeia archaeon]